MTGTNESLPESDTNLLVAWRCGDRRAGATLYTRHLGTLARFFRNKVPCGDDEDLTHRVFIALLEGDSHIRGELRSYLLGIARNVLRGYIREKRSDATFDDRMFDFLSGPTSVFTRHRRSRLLLEALRRLRLSQQMMLELYYWEGYNSTQLAEYFDSKPSTIRTRLHDARGELGRLMTELAGQRDIVDADLDSWARELRELVGPDLSA